MMENKSPFTGRSRCKVHARIHVEEGTKSMVRQVREEFFLEGETEPSRIRVVFPNRAYSKAWEQDFTQGLKTNNFHRGYPDTQVEVQTLKQDPVNGVIQKDL